MKHSHRVHSSKRNLSLKAKSYPVERKEGNTEGQTELAVWMGETPRYRDGGARVGVSRKQGHLYHLKGNSHLILASNPTCSCLFWKTSKRWGWAASGRGAGGGPKEGARRGGRRDK